MTVSARGARGARCAGQDELSDVCVSVGYAVAQGDVMLNELRQDYDMLEVWVRENYVGLDTLAELTLMWGTERNLIEGSTSSKQMLKLVEEMGELASGLAKKNPEVVKDSIGDCLVVLSMIAAQEGLALSECWLSAWKDIKDRKGRMVDGVFVKEADLPEADLPEAS